MDKRWRRVAWGPDKPRVRTSEANWRQPVRWEKEHEAFEREHGRCRRVFCGSLCDVFDNQAPGAWRADLWDLIESTPHLDWLLLTKRIGNAESMIPDARLGYLWPNVWLVSTVVDQPEADRDISKLLKVRASIHGLSIEPMLGPIDVTRYLQIGARDIDGIVRNAVSWVICGGESGPNARPMHPDWVRSLRDQCRAAGTPFFFKQWGGQTPTARGCKLDGNEAKEWPASPFGGPVDNSAKGVDRLALAGRFRTLQPHLSTG